ncbi:MAG: class II fructose-bisphosphate aldolase, partial [Lachnospiraceae bacterium]|nr:class II fructose-bisphosphate aldolase [Lachnospiraceae bacterium]
MLITLKEIMDIAEEKKIAIGAFNASGLEAIEAELAAAEELKLPVIIQFAQCHEPWIPLTTIGPIMIQMAEKSSVPVCIHLDHGETLEYLETALELGFTGIMYDGSTLSYEENLENTVKAVTMAGKYGASVEAELGSMGKREFGDGNADEEDTTKIYTDPELAA